MGGKRTIANAEIADALEVARDRMNSKGEHWIKGAYHRLLGDRGRCYCAVGAINSVSKQGYALNGAMCRAVYEIGMGSRYRTPFARELWARNNEAKDAIINFNDHPCTLWKDVDRLFRNTIEGLRKGMTIE